ncbi:class IIb bacteriocin, lactobin A/cerein 7B family [Fructobacillus durionis]|uniref:Class IIb bacteriocin, lactobin A/cerein 7B family n=1 Tax=Fructobacillus durionis TaxID=283737 RepID=A0A1I1F3U6_9LACO|nr:class IIb bacteriocin, lactobin A/cerein 7B family [Fructobacillus durionis]SFB93941.1 class IIb bacteriocin, lactobin A/cerein 7B family [Fructobacillus durionis]
MDSNGFQIMEEYELAKVNGGIFPIVIGGVLITKGAAIGAGCFTAGIGAGLYLGLR